MTSASPQPQGVHLVGSVPLQSTEDVLRTATGILDGRLRRIPDGETGVRSNWIQWQSDVMARVPQLEMIPPDPAGYVPMAHFKLRQGADVGAIAFGPLGYAEAARNSYAVFARLRAEGVIPAGLRFQVCLPTPLAPVSAFVMPQDQAAVEPHYEVRMLAELDEIAGTIPRDDLAMQWDTAIEFALLEDVFPTATADVHAGILERLVRIGARVPEGVELGYHLCYGDAGHQHFVQPRDTSKLVDVANALAAQVQRSINWIHMPVPRDRADEAYFAPLRDLKLQPGTELYLGLVHYSDGEAGTRRRIEAAQQAVTQFGVATECGFGRRPPETVPDLLRIHAAVAAPVA